MLESLVFLRGSSAPAELTERWLRRGYHRSTKGLVASIRTWIGLWNEDPRPFAWHKGTEEILHSLTAYCERISDSGHQPLRRFNAIMFSQRPRTIGGEQLGRAALD